MAKVPEIEDESADLLRDSCELLKDLDKRYGTDPDNPYLGHNSRCRKCNNQTPSHESK